MVGQSADPRLIWASFAALDQAIDELQAMLLEEQLIGSFGNAECETAWTHEI